MIKHLPTLAVLAIAAGIFAAAPAAHADALYGPLTVTVWTGTGTNAGYVTDTASLPTPSSAVTATFNYTGPLNFVNNSSNNADNTFGNFLNSSDITNFTSSDSLTTFLNTLLMSTPGETSPSINTYMLITGTYTAASNTSVSIAHDDGASFYVNGSSTALFGCASPTVDTGSCGVSSGTLLAGTNVPFDLVYVESNGSPSDLVVTGLSPVPEPGTIGLMALGMIGLGALMYRGAGFNS